MKVFEQKLKQIDLVIIDTTLSSDTLSITGFRLIVIPISTNVEFGLLLGMNVVH